MERSYRNWLSSIISYLILSWTILCFLGTWFVILKYGILLKGLIAIMTTFFFAAAIWMVPVTGFVLLSVYTDRENSPHAVTFKDLIRKGMAKSEG